ncbi:DUF4260 domain-containing protein [Tabrizicola aquatica]|uniref:DUF4260 domain-containing protein n=1 Tax=Tabrizicola aquatica TaxID=909926 RepID=UPI000CD098F5|nr:DUF4260 domain-containing protein [Tabrizicola aquatica]
MARAVLWQRVEGALVLCAVVAVLAQPWQPLAWWVLILAFFVPDLSFAAYLAGPRIGAFGYNLVHVYGFGAAVLALGAGLDQPWITALGFLWLGHSGFDRMLGYGLKLPEGFGHTHLGRIGRDG